LVLLGLLDLLAKKLVKKLEEDGFEVFKFVREMFKMKMKYSGALQNRK
jgi:sulfur relay (sulfurtransferase) DsrC/TusE family protein